MHKISLLKYLVGANLKQLVLTESNGPIVDCYIIIGQWIIRTQTPEGGCPHAEILCLSILGREKADEIIVSLSPCDSFGKTPPCCYSLLASCSNILIMQLDKTQQDSSRLLACFTNVGQIAINKPSLISNAAFNYNLTTICSNIYTTENAKFIHYNPNVKSINSTYHLGWPIIKIAISLNSMIITDVYLLSNWLIIYYEELLYNSLRLYITKLLASTISFNNLITNRLRRLGTYKLIYNNNIYDKLSSIEINSLLEKFNGPWPVITTQASNKFLLEIKCLIWLNKRLFIDDYIINIT